MSRITKAIAEHVAIELTKKKWEEVKDLGSQISDMVETMYNKKIPETVKELFALHPRYFRTTNSIRLHGNGFHYEWVTLKNHVITERNHEDSYEPKNSEIKPLRQLIDSKEKLAEDTRKLQTSIENSLIQLRTFKAVTTHFPEAAEFLPSEQTSFLPAINLDSIREQLK